MTEISSVGLLGCGRMGLCHVAEYRRRGVDVVAFGTSAAQLNKAEFAGARRVWNV
jgi:hypothetical protein